MTTYRRSALAVSISFIILITLSLFLYSCGVSSPTGSSTNTLSTNTSTTATTPQGVQAIISASSTPTSITINITTASIGTQYILYRADLNATASNAVKYTGSNTYNFPLSPDKTYKFLVTEIDNKGKEIFTGAYIISSPSTNNIKRNDIVQNPPLIIPDDNLTPNNQTAPSSSSLMGLNMTNPFNPPSLFGLNGLQNSGTRIGITYSLSTWTTDSTIHIVEATGGHYVGHYSLFYAMMIGHPEGNYTSKAAYKKSLEGKYDSDYGYTNQKASGTYKIGLIYYSTVKEIQEFFGPIYVTYTVWDCKGQVGQTLGPYYLPNAGPMPPPQTDPTKPPIPIPSYYILSDEVSFNTSSLGGQCGGGTPPPPVNKKLAKIDITPTGLTTIYIHPKKPDAGKPDHGSQQYTAMGTFEGESVPVDVTKTGDVIWHSSKPEIAKMSTKQGEEGLFVPVTTPKITLGTTDIQATSAIPAAPADIKSNIAHLCVECWEYTHYRQNAQNRFPNDCWWSDDPYARNWDPIYKKDKNGNIIIDKKTKQPIIIDWKDLGPRYRDQVTGKVVKQIQNSKGIWIDPTIGAVGCHMTSAAMVLTATTEESVDPRLLNNWLNGHNGYSTFNGPLWKVVQQYPNSKIIYATDEQAMVDNAVGRTWDDSIKNIKGALQNCDMVVLTVTGDLAHHYVLLIKENNGSYKIRDPWLFNSDKTIASLDDLSTHYRITHYNIILIFKI